MNICGYCAKEMHGTPGDAVIAQHIENCAKHPVAELKRENVRLREALKEISQSNHGQNCDQLSDEVAKEALEGK